MTKDEIQKIIEDTLLADYGADIRGLPEDTPVTKIRDLSSKLDSLEFLQFIFNIEDKTGIDLPDGISAPETIGEILDIFYETSLNK
jgi:acyl carrier protein